MTVTNVIAIIFGSLGILTSVLFFIKNRQLSKIIFLYQKQKDKDEKAEKDKSIKFTKAGFEREAHEYNAYIKSQFQYLDFTGMNTILQRPIPLEDIYVKLKVVHSINSYEDTNFIETKTPKTDLQPEAFVDSLNQVFENRLKVRTTIRILILGHPGSGKTTLMKWIALQCQNPSSVLLYTHIPVFISLKDFGKNPDDTYRKYSIREISLRSLRANNIDTGFLKDSFNSNKILFLLDGLDEVADEGIRREIIDWIQRQNILRSLLIITSRYSGIQLAKGITFNSSIPVFEIQNFSKNDIGIFLTNWYKNIEIAVNKPENKEYAISLAEEKSADLINVIKGPNHKSLALLAINPLLLTIIALVHRTRAVLPKERHKLYEEAVKVMVELWNISNKRLEMNFTFENSITNISMLAHYLMQRNSKELSEDEIKKILPSTIENKSVNTFLNEMILKSGLLFSSEGKYGFLHLTFQEYLAARYFAKCDNQNLILDYIEEDFWIETIKLFVNIGNTHILFTELIKRAKAGSYKKINFLLELAHEIVVDEDKQKYTSEIFILLLPNLLKLKNNAEDDKRAIDLYHPSIGSYLGVSKKDEKIFWPLFEESENYFAKAISIILLLNFRGKCERELVGKLKEHILSVEKKFEEIKLSYQNIEKNKKKINVKDAIKHNLEAEIDLESSIVKYCYNIFNSLAVFTRNIDDFSFLLTMLSSKVYLFRFLAIITLRDFEQIRPLAAKLQISKLAIIKPIQDQTILQDKKADEIMQVQNIITPQNFTDITKDNQFHYWKEIRPVWQIDQLVLHFATIKNKIKKTESECLKAYTELKSQLDKLDIEDRKAIFDN